MSHVYASLKRISIDTSAIHKSSSIAEYVNSLFQPNSILRWSWQELAFYEIVDINKYHARMEAFATFYNRFYQGQRKYSLNPEEQYTIFDYPIFGITFVAFSSCCNNDLLNKQGRIHPDALSAAANELHNIKYKNRLLIALWHHNTSGGPSDIDYLDADVLQVFIDCGFSIGLHGHQHKPQYINEQFLFGSNRKITIISAGTLCGGKREIPLGYARSYNILTIDTDKYAAVLHQRRMMNNDLALPVWAPGWYPSSGHSYVSFDIQHPITSANDLSRLEEAEQHIATKEYGIAKTILRPLYCYNGLARRMLLECYINQPNAQEVIQTFFPPASVAEAIYVADALWEEKDYRQLRLLLGSEFISQSTDPAIIEIRTKYMNRLSR